MGYCSIVVCLELVLSRDTFGSLKEFSGDTNLKELVYNLTAAF